MPEYDSRPDTYEHIFRVQLYMFSCIEDLLERAHLHDRSKLKGIEKDAFDVATPKLRDTEYGSPEYRQSLLDIQPAIQEHYKRNSHHPEHYEAGIDGMTLMDLVEMFCDWKAAGERHANGGSIHKSIEHNKERFGISDQLAQILQNTADHFNW